MIEETVMESLKAIVKLTDEIYELQSRIEKLEAENIRFKDEIIPSLKNEIELVRKRAFQ
jgi:cell division protein FtsB